MDRRGSKTNGHIQPCENPGDSTPKTPVETFGLFQRAYDELNDHAARLDLTLDFARKEGPRCAEQIGPLLDRLAAAEPDDSRYLSPLRLIRGWIYYELGNLDTAGDCFAQSLRAAKRTQDEVAVAKALNGVASIHLSRRRFAESLDSYEEAMAIVERLGDESQQCVLANNIANLLIDIGLPKEAIARLRGNQAAGRNDELVVVKTSATLAWGYFAAGDRKNAIDCVEDVLRRTGPDRHPELHAEAMLYGAQIASTGGDYTQARRYFDEVTRLYPDVDTNPRFVAIVLATKGNLAMADGHPDQAVWLFKMATDGSEHPVDTTLLMATLNALVTAAQAAGDHPARADALQRILDLRREMSGVRETRAMTQARERQAAREERLYRELYGKITTIGEIGRLMTSTLDLSDIIRVLAGHIRRLMPSDIFGISLYDEREATLDYRLLTEGDQLLPRPKVPAGLDEPTLGGWVVRNREAILIGDIKLEYWRYLPKIPARHPSSKAETRAVMYVPLIVENRIVGVMTAQSYAANTYRTHDLDVLRILGGYAAIAIQNARLYERIHTLATTDALTGAMNRRRLMEQVGKAMETAHQDGTRFAIILTDLDHFKQVNDAEGHVSGDAVLKEFATVCMARKRDADLFARYGGEEFLFLLHDANIESSVAFAERLRRSTEQIEVQSTSGNTIRLTASFGVTLNHRDDETPEQIVERADAALYRAKEAGRNRVEAAE